MKKARLLAQLPDPDVVGSAEYRELHDFLNSMEVVDGEEPRELFAGALTEFENHIEGIRRRLGLH